MRQNMMEEAFFFFELGTLTEENICQVARILKTFVNGERISKLKNGTYKIVKNDIEWELSIPGIENAHLASVWALTVRVTDGSENILPHHYAIRHMVHLFKTYHLDALARKMERVRECALPA